MKNKKLLLIVGAIAVVCICLVCCLSLVVLIIANREQEIGSNDEAKEILDDSIESIKKDLNNKDKFKITIDNEQNGNYSSIAIDPNKKLVQIFYSEDNVSMYLTESTIVRCIEKKCIEVNDPSTSDDYRIRILQKNYDAYLEDIEKELLTGSTSAFSVLDEIKNSDGIKYSDNIDCGEFRCFSITVDYINSYIVMLIDTNTKQIRQAVIFATNSESKVIFDIEYDFELELPEVTETVEEPTDKFSDARNGQRSSDVNVILNAVTQYTSEQGNSIDDFGVISNCSQTSLSIGTGTGAGKNNIDLGALLVDKYISNIPTDPSDGTDVETGYEICLTAGGREKISAPKAEAGEVIEVQR